MIQKLRREQNTPKLNKGSGRQKNHRL